MLKRMGKAAVLEHFHQPLQLRNFPLQREPEEGSAWVKTEMAGICGTDVHLWKGELPIQLPVILGHETVGTLSVLGPRLAQDWRGETLKKGDRVTWTSSSSCGHCYYCKKIHQPTRCPERRAYGIGYRCDQEPHFLGGYGQYHFLRSGVNLFRIPDALSTESVIGAGCALVTAIHGVERLCGEKPIEKRWDSIGMPQLPEMWRETVVVQGTGPVGIAAIAVARRAGAKQIIALGGPSHRLKIAKRFGADVCLAVEDLSRADQRISAVLDVTEGYGADVVLECVGHPNAVEEGAAMCRDGGKFLVMGQYCDSGTFEFRPHIITRKQLQVIGTWSSEPRHMAAALGFLESCGEEFPFASLVTHRFPLEEAHEALQAVAHWRSVKSVIVPWA